MAKIFTTLNKDQSQKITMPKAMKKRFSLIKIWSTQNKEYGR